MAAKEMVNISAENLTRWRTVGDMFLDASAVQLHMSMEPPLPRQDKLVPRVLCAGI